MNNKFISKAKENVMKSLLIVISIIILFGCGKDNTTDDLSGSVWVYEEVVVAFLLTETLRFGDDKNVVLESVMTMLDNESISTISIFNGAYTYNHPAITVLVSDGDTSISMDMTFKNNVIEFVDDGDVYLYYKK